MMNEMKTIDPAQYGPSALVKDELNHPKLMSHDELLTIQNVLFLNFNT